MVTLGFSLVAGLTPDGVDTQSIWRRSLAGGVLARRLAADRLDDPSDDAFVAGLLSNIGRLALAGVVVENGAGAEDLADPWLTAADEMDQLGYTTDDVTARLLGGWGLPDVLVEAIRDP